MGFTRIKAGQPRLLGQKVSWSPALGSPLQQRWVGRREEELFVASHERIVALTGSCNRTPTLTASSPPVCLRVPSMIARIGALPSSCSSPCLKPPRRVSMLSLQPGGGVARPVPVRKLPPGAA